MSNGFGLLEVVALLLFIAGQVLRIKGLPAKWRAVVALVAILSAVFLFYTGLTRAQ